MDIKPPRKLQTRQSSGTQLVVRNSCESTIWPGLLTQSGNGPGTNGFALSSGTQRSFIVSEDWQGRVWGRTNCSFNGGGTSSTPCGTGDCGNTISCIGTGEVPTTLAEFTLDAGDGHTYYDLSLVDGYNLPIAIQMLPETNGSFQRIPQRLTNPSCVGTVGEAHAPGYNPYPTFPNFLGTTARDPLQFEKQETLSDIAQWCPWDLQTSSATSPSGGVYVYPDGQVDRPAFDPCLSACAKYNRPADCCTGAYDSPSSCSPSTYSKMAKAVCPDAYSYAFDDQTSTFIIPAGAGFEVIFCPGARSTNIIATSKGELVQLAQTGTASKQKRLIDVKGRDITNLQPNESQNASKQKRLITEETYYITEVHHNDSWYSFQGPTLQQRNGGGRSTQASMLGLIVALAVLVAFSGQLFAP